MSFFYVSGKCISINTTQIIKVEWGARDECLTARIYLDSQSLQEPLEAEVSLKGEDAEKLWSFLHPQEGLPSEPKPLDLFAGQ
jgi:hypothetical protein